MRQKSNLGKLISFLPGRGIGALIAGVLFDRYKARLIYQCLAGASFAAGILYAVLYYALIKRLPKLAVRKVDFAGKCESTKQNS